MSWRLIISQTVSTKMLKIAPFLVMLAVTTNALAARIARSPGGAGWQSSSGYDSGPSLAARSSSWNSGDIGRSAGNGWGTSGSGFGWSSGGSDGWGGSFGKSSGSWGDSNGYSSDWAGASNGYGSGSGGYSSRSNGYGSGSNDHGSGLTGSIDFRSNGNGWQASW